MYMYMYLKGNIFSQVDLFAFLQFCTFCWYNFLRNVDLNKRAANYLRVIILQIYSHSQKYQKLIHVKICHLNVCR